MKTGQFGAKLHPNLIPNKQGSPEITSGQFVPSNFSGFYMPYQMGAGGNAYDYDIDVQNEEQQ